MTIHYRQQGSVLIILGNTYAFRDELKALGARFNGSDRNWRMPLTPDNLSAVAALCGKAGGGNLGEAASEAPTQLSQALSTLPLSPTLLRGSKPRATDLTVAGSADVEQSLTIRQLMERLEAAVSRAFPSTVWVTGEVQNLARKGSGLFFDLAEARASGHANATVTVRAILWSSTLNAIQARRGEDKLAEVLQEGLQIRCLCQVQLYKDRGSVSLLITDIDPAFTKGALALAREKLLKELRAKGLEQANKRLPRPAFPLRIGLISAEGSRAKSDFLDQLWSLGYPGEVVFVPATMQGEQVPRQVVQALSRLAAAGCDLIVMTRGGGSAADLRWFDAPEIAYAIAQSPVPIIAAIGHHEDVCVAEEICHLRQKTPTAAADFVVSICQETRAHIDAMAAVLAKTLDHRLAAFAVLTAALAERLHAGAARALELRRTALSQWGHGLQRGAEGRIHGVLSRFEGEKAKLNLAAERRLGAEATKLAALEGQLLQRDPSAWLAQGWTRLSGAAGPITQLNQVQLGETLRARLADGWLSLGVLRTEAKYKKDEEPTL